MRPLLRSLGLALLVPGLVLALAPLPGCFQVDQPICSYKCGTGTGSAEPACPEDYECRSDGYCHLTGTTEACTFSDASVVIDMSAAAPDLNLDGATGD